MLRALQKIEFKIMSQKYKPNSQVILHKSEYKYASI